MRMFYRSAPKYAVRAVEESRRDGHPVVLKRIRVKIRDLLAEYIFRAATKVILCERGHSRTRPAIPPTSTPSPCSSTGHPPCSTQPRHRQLAIVDWFQAAIAAGADNLLICDPAHERWPAVAAPKFAALMKQLSRVAAAVDREISVNSKLALAILTSPQAASRKFCKGDCLEMRF